MRKSAPTFGFLCRIPMLILCAAVLAGCLSARLTHRVGPADVMLPDLPDHCGAAMVAELDGQPFTMLADHTLPGPLRVIWPGQVVLAEVQPNRLNAEVSADGRIQQVFCG